jgi:hypothetical protein
VWFFPWFGDDDTTDVGPLSTTNEKNMFTPEEMMLHPYLVFSST